MTYLNYFFRSLILLGVFCVAGCESDSDYDDENNSEGVISFLGLSPLNISNSAQSFIVEFESENSDVVIDSYSSWISLIDDSVYGSYQFSAEANSSSESREGYIYFSSGEYTSKFTVIQEGLSVGSYFSATISESTAFPLAVQFVGQYALGFAAGETLVSAGICYGYDTEVPTVYYNRYIDSPYSTTIGTNSVLNNSSSPWVIRNLAPNKVYNFRQYAITNKGTYYGDAVQYSTMELTTDDNYRSLPVIFHVLYSEEDSPLNLKREVIYDMFETSNLLFRGMYDSDAVDLNIQFDLATQDPNGVTLSEEGIIRHCIGNVEINENDFIYQYSEYGDYLWDTDEYINVFLYDFAAESDGNSVTNGISPVALLPNAYSLDGLISSDYYLVNKSGVMFGISVNSSTTLSSNATLHTLAHECGHYLGLLHAFGEDSDGVSACDETDYCDDTPNYNRTSYISSYSSGSSSNTYYRTSCDGERFVSTNLMDYNDSYFSAFTQDQKERVDYVLNYGIFVPTVAGRSGSRTPTVYDDVKPEIRLY